MLEHCQVCIFIDSDIFIMVKGIFWVFFLSVVDIFFKPGPQWHLGDSDQPQVRKNKQISICGLFPPQVNQYTEFRWGQISTHFQFTQSSIEYLAARCEMKWNAHIFLLIKKPNYGYKSIKCGVVVLTQACLQKVVRAKHTNVFPMMICQCLWYALKAGHIHSGITLAHMLTA